MGIVEEKIEETKSVIRAIKNDIPPSRFFELGADISILKKLERHIEKITSILKELEPIYHTKSFPDAKSYFDAMLAVQTIQDTLKDIRRKEEGSLENTRRFIEHVNELETIIHNFLGNKPLTKKKNDNRYPQATSMYGMVTSKGGLPLESGFVNTNQHDRSNVQVVKIRSLLPKAFNIIFIRFPHIVGRAVLDIFGHGKDSADTTSMLIGYVLIVIVMLVLWGIVDINSLLNWFTGIWRFFNPVE